MQQLDLNKEDQETKELEMRAFNLDSDTYDQLAQLKAVTSKELSRMIESTQYHHAKISFNKLLSEYKRINNPDVKMIASDLGHIALKGPDTEVNTKLNYYHVIKL